MTVKLAGLELEHPLMNAAGTCKTLEDVEKFARSAVSAIVVGSITVDARTGNEGNVYWKGDGYSLNSLGLPNRGLGYYEKRAGWMVQTAHQAGKPLIASVAGFDDKQYALLCDRAVALGFDAVELNLGCPNVWVDGEQKKIASFDRPAISYILDAVYRLLGEDIPVGVKLSPFSDPTLLESVAKTFWSYPVGYVAACNTFPNSMQLDQTGTPVISVGLAGLSGAAMKPISIGQVTQLKRNLPSDIQMVGVGGVMNGQDITDYLNAGATAVQAATAYWNAGENPGVYGDILSTYEEV